MAAVHEHVCTSISLPLVWVSRPVSSLVRASYSVSQPSCGLCYNWYDEHVWCVHKPWHGDQCHQHSKTQTWSLQHKLANVSSVRHKCLGPIDTTHYMYGHSSGTTEPSIYDQVFHTAGQRCLSSHTQCSTDPPCLKSIHKRLTIRAFLGVSGSIQHVVTITKVKPLPQVYYTDVRNRVQFK